MSFERETTLVRLVERGHGEERLAELDRQDVVDDGVRDAVKEIDERGEIRYEIDVEEIVLLQLSGFFGRAADHERRRKVVLEIGPEKEDATGQLATKERQRYERNDNREVELARVQVLILVDCHSTRPRRQRCLETRRAGC